MTTETTDVARSAAITGAGNGLGREIAIGFADKGYRVFGTARISPRRTSLRTVYLTGRSAVVAQIDSSW